MYGKTFISALLFLAVAQVKAQDEDYADEVEAYEATPEPDVEFDENAAEVTIPDGDWLISYAAFELFELPEDDPIWDWADGLGDDLDYYEPTGWVLVGTTNVSAGEGDVLALGLQESDGDAGVAAVFNDGEFSSVLFNFDDDAQDDGDIDGEPDFLAEPQDLTSQDGIVDNAGTGSAWGQSLSEDGEWNIWIYNIVSDDWSDGSPAHDVLFVQYDSAADQWSTFTDSIEILSGASSLMATAAFMTAIASLI